MTLANIIKKTPYCPKCERPADSQTRTSNYGREGKLWFFTYKCKCNKILKYYADDDFKVVQPTS